MKANDRGKKQLCLWIGICILLTISFVVRNLHEPQAALFITSLAKEVMFLVALVSLSVCLIVCLFVCGQHYSKSYERIGMKFYGRVLSSTRKN